VATEEAATWLKPAWQLHLYEPLTLTQSCGQRLSVQCLHSSTSADVVTLWDVVVTTRLLLLPLLLQYHNFPWSPQVKSCHKRSTFVKPFTDSSFFSNARWNNYASNYYTENHRLFVLIFSLIFLVLAHAVENAGYPSVSEFTKNDILTADSIGNF